VKAEAVMKQPIATKVLDSIRRILETPTFYGSQERAEGIAVGLAASLFSERKQVSIGVALGKIHDLVRKACDDIERSPCAGVYLCTESVEPEWKTSYDALRHHGAIFLKLLEEAGFNNMYIIRQDIDAAIQSLQITPDLFRPLSDAESAQVVRQVLDKFVGGVQRTWWWEALGPGAVSRHVQDGFKLVAEIVPAPDEIVWFIAEDDDNSGFPVYEATPRAAQQVIGECAYFEYYLVAKDMSWLLCENHHDVLIGVGEAVTTRLARLSEN
jgi:hypothetical protein